MQFNKITIETLDNDISNDGFNILNDNITALSSYKIDSTQQATKVTKHSLINNQVISESKSESDDDNVDVDLLKKMVIRWITLDDNIKEFTKKAKDIKDEKTQIEEKILYFMKQSETNEIQVKDGKLEKKRGEKKEPINEEYIKKCLVKSFDDVEMVDKLTKLLIENREITETYRLARKGAPKSKSNLKKKT